MSQRSWYGIGAGLAVVSLGLASARGGLIDWHVAPGGVYFSGNSTANWVPYGGVNPNNANGVATGVSGEVSWSIWDNYGPHGYAGAGSNHDMRDFGGKQFDVMAMYARHDASALYVGIVTGFDPAGVRDPYDQNILLSLGDLAINPNWNSHTAQLTVDTKAGAVGTSGTAKLYAGGTWGVLDSGVGFAPPPDTNLMSGGTLTANDILYSYNDTGVDYYDPIINRDVSISLLEFTIPLKDLGPSGNGAITLAFAPSCSNDAMQVTEMMTPLVSVPEPATLGLIGAGAAVLMMRRRK